MDAIKINVEVSLSEATLEALRAIAVSVSSAIMTTNLSKVLADKELVRTVGAEVIEGQREVQTAVSEQKKELKEEAAEEAAAPAEDIPGDLPDFDEVSDDELISATRKAVAGVKAKGKSPAFIRTDIFKKYGISESKACPAEKRAELLDELKKLW